VIRPLQGCWPKGPATACPTTAQPPSFANPAPGTAFDRSPGAPPWNAVPRIAGLSHLNPRKPTSDFQVAPIRKVSAIERRHPCRHPCRSTTAHLRRSNTSTCVESRCQLGLRTRNSTLCGPRCEKPAPSSLELPAREQPNTREQRDLAVASALGNGAKTVPACIVMAVGLHYCEAQDPRICLSRRAAIE
jgi:hypothetical protein